MSDEIEEYRAVANALASWSDGPLAGDARKAITALIGMYETQASKLDAFQRAAQEGHPTPCTLGPLCPYCEIDRLKSRLDAEQQRVKTLEEALAAAKSPEVCYAPHENVGECGYCQRDRLALRLDRIRDWATRGRQFNLYAEAVGHIFAELDEERDVEGESND